MPAGVTQAGQPNPGNSSAGQPNSSGAPAGQPNGAGAEVQPLINLIAMSVLPESEKAKFNEMVAHAQSRRSSSNNMCFYTKLPDQEHCYYLGNSLNGRCLEGTLITSIPFTHPTHVPQILVFLRQQVLFNVILGSCIRKMSSFSSAQSQQSTDSIPRFTFELSYHSMSSVNVTFEHPVDESLASLDIDMRDVTGVKCRLHTLPNSTWSIPTLPNSTWSIPTLPNSTWSIPNPTRSLPSSTRSLGPDSYLITEDLVTRIMQRSLSIPITLRMIITRVREKYRQHKESESLKKEKERIIGASFNSLPTASSGGGTGDAGGENDSFSQLMANYNNARHSSAVSSKLTSQSAPALSASAASESPVTASPLMQLVSNLTTQQQLLKAAMASAEVATSTGNLVVASSLATEIQTRQRMVQTLLGQIAKQRQIEMARANAHAQASGVTPGGKAASTLSKQ